VTVNGKPWTDLDGEWGRLPGDSEPPSSSRAGRSSEDAGGNLNLGPDNMRNTPDRGILRDLAQRVAEVAHLPIMAERRREWTRHNALRPGRPMILIFPEGAWGELLPAEALRCESPEARRMELDLRRRLYAFEHFDSDNVVEAEWVVAKGIRSTGWGLEARRHDSPAARGAWAFDPVLRRPADIKKLRFPEITHDERATARRLEVAQDLFGDILEVRLKGVSRLSFHLMAHYTGLRGLEQTMVDMCVMPEELHAAMAFLTEGNLRLIRQYEALNLLSLNNDNTYHSSGGVGYTTELPAPDFDPGHVRPCDLWASAETQELAQVSPRMHAEFAIRYEKRLLAAFGRNGYGCCDNLTQKLDEVLTIPNIRRISIAPSADVEACAARLGSRAIFSWKPDPTYLVGEFDPERVRGYIRHTLKVTGACVLEMILKDTHTCDGHPERFDQWSGIARQLVEA
jgi:hypothetical protein